MLETETFSAVLVNDSGEEFRLTDEELKKSFAKCLRELRKYCNYTLKQVSEATGIFIPTVQRYESGENTPSIVQAFKFSCFYQLSIDDMFLAGHADYDEREKIFEERIGKHSL